MVPEFLDNTLRRLNLGNLLSARSTLDEFIRDKLYSSSHTASPSSFVTATTTTAIAIATAVNYAVNATNNANSTSSSTDITSSPSTLQQVSWQTVFWAIVSIALNTCLQESGSILDHEPHLGILIKSSPIFCLLDSVVILAQLVLYTINHGPRRALQLVASSRRQHDVNTTHDAKPAYRLIVGAILLLLAIIQAIKLFALRGVVWTQLFGAMYLLSYTVNALLNTLGKQPGNLYPQEVPDVRRGDIWPTPRTVSSFALAAAVGQLLFWTSILGRTISSGELDGLGLLLWPAEFVIGMASGVLKLFFVAAPLCLAVVDLAIMVLPSALLSMTVLFSAEYFMPALVDSTADHLGCSGSTLRQYFHQATILVGSTLQTCYHTAFLLVRSAMREEGWLQKLNELVVGKFETYGLLYAFALCCLLVAFLVFYLVCQGLFISRVARSMEMDRFGITSSTSIACLFMFLANIALALVYYAHIYTPDGTYKPAWTNNLGR